MKDFFSFLISKDFLKQLLYVLIFLGIVAACVLLWLRSYTNHGQKLVLPSYIGKHIQSAQKEAASATFEILVRDSVHVVGQEGGIILEQNPKPEALVKENRKIHVTTTKYNPDTYLLSELPSLYGNEFDQKMKDLKRFEIHAKIKEKQYDPGEPNHILEVYYQGKKIISQNSFDKEVKIQKGGTLDFVVSDRQGGKITIPDLTCQQFSAAEFLLKAGNKLSISRVLEVGEIIDRNTAYVVDQSPRSDGETEIEMGGSITLTIAQDKPATCD